MKKPYLLIAGNFIYPNGGTEDWVGCFETIADAESRVKRMELSSHYKSGKFKGKVKSKSATYTILKLDGSTEHRDWYEIVDLRDWADGTET